MMHFGNNCPRSKGRRDSGLGTNQEQWYRTSRRDSDPIDVTMKHYHEFRDPIHTFISARTDERSVIDSRPFQRLRQIHQLALTYLVYPGATHRRFEHSLGVMELATRIFDIVTNPANIFDSNVQDIIPDADALRYWRSVLRMAALCHDIGHLPFSHAAEHRLLPEGYDHERLTIELIKSAEMQSIWSTMTPPLREQDILKLAVGPKKAKGFSFSTWETILSEIIVGDAFGADRIDYLLRDSYHAGVKYGNFDHSRLINTMRILPRRDQESDEPALGLENGGLESSEALMLARHFIYKQVYLHPIRRVYDIHLIDFLNSWLEGGRFSVNLEDHLAMSDAEVITAIRAAARDTSSPSYGDACRIERRNHFRLFYSASPGDKDGGVLRPGEKLFDLAQKEFDPKLIRHDYLPARIAAPDFPVKMYDNTIQSSLKISEVLRRLPGIEVDSLFCCKSIVKDAIRWRTQIKVEALDLTRQEGML
jgi:HD superfamily phosphohydrolase